MRTPFVLLRRSIVAVSVVVAVALGATDPLAADPAYGHGNGYVIDGQKVFPEGVATDGRYVYATSYADGTVYRGRVSGSTLEPFLASGQDGRTTATGIKSTGRRLLITGGNTGRFYIYDARSGALVATYSVPRPDQPTFLNDEVVTPNGDVYITDSVRPVIYRIPATDVNARPTGASRTLDPVATLPGYTTGFNANGIVATPGGKALLVVYTNTGALYRVDLASGSSQQVELDHPLVNGDGLLLLGNTLYAARNFDNLIATVKLSEHDTHGTTIAERSYPGADVPTTLALSRGRLLAINSQFDTFINGAPQTSPTFTISNLSLR